MAQLRIAKSNSIRERVYFRVTPSETTGATLASESLKTVLEKVHSGKIVLPEFQRDFVWGEGSVVKLMSSIFNGYPIGSLLLMENNDAYSFRPIDGAEKKEKSGFNDQELILDGQQRITSCYRAFFGTVDKDAKQPSRYYFRYGDYVKAAMSGAAPEGSALEELFEFVRLSKVKKTLNNISAEISMGFFPLDIILRESRGYDYSKWLGQYNFSESKGESQRYSELTNISSAFQKIIERVTGYQINYEKIFRETNPDVICTIFETINTTGVKLTVFDLLVAKCFKKNINLRDLLDDAWEKSEWIRKYDASESDRSGKDLASTHLPRILGQIIKRECKKGIILELDAGDIANEWHKAVAGLNKALMFLHSRYGAIREELIPSTDIITPLAMILLDVRVKPEHYSMIDRWYWRCVFSQYFKGAPETKISRSVREILGADGWLFGGSVKPESIENFQIHLGILDDATKNTTVYKGLMTLMISSRPYDIGIERNSLHSLPYGEIHDHHIYPLKYLRDNGIKGSDANQILNRMPIWKNTNERISSFSPAEYTKLDGLGGALLCHNFIDEDLEKYFGISIQKLRCEFSHAGFFDFISDRKERFVEMIRSVTRFDGSIGSEIADD
jgi:hypothetical protein